MCEVGHASPVLFLCSSGLTFLKETQSISLPGISWKNLESCPPHSVLMQKSEATISHPHLKRDHLNTKLAWCFFQGFRVLMPWDRSPESLMRSTVACGPQCVVREQARWRKVPASGGERGGGQHMEAGAGGASLLLSCACWLLQPSKEPPPPRLAATAEPSLVTPVIRTAKLCLMHGAGLGSGGSCSDPPCRLRGWYFNYIN